MTRARHGQQLCRITSAATHPSGDDVHDLDALVVVVRGKEDERRVSEVVREGAEQAPQRRREERRDAHDEGATVHRVEPLQPADCCAKSL